MSRLLHTPEQRLEILERVKSIGRPVSEIAQEQGVSVKKIHNWMGAKKVRSAGFVEVPTTPLRVTVAELSFADGTALRIRG